MKYFATVLFLLIPAAASAATISFSQLPVSVGVGDVVQVTLSVDTHESVNAFSGNVTYSKNLVPLSVSDGHSVIPLWIDAPHIASSSIVFAGVVPAGFVGKGKLLSVLFRTQSAGDATLDIEGAQVLLNDGSGTPAEVVDAPYQFSVKADSQGGYVMPDDTNPPQAFTPLVSMGPDGREYLLFTTTDAGSGVHTYEVSEHRPLSLSAPHFVPAQSPYLLEDQYLTSDIEVRAVDALGNVRVETYPHARLVRPYEEGLLIAILIGVAVSIYLYFRRHVSISWTNTL